MLNLVSRAPHSIVSVVGQSVYQNYCGLLTGPFSGFDPATAVAFGAPWAADNGCYAPGYNVDRILSMLRRYQGVPNCKWVVVPDEVRNAAATMQMFSVWLGTYQRYGYPVALVIQNGIEHCRIPWDSIACVFIGGDDAFKYSDVVRNIVTDAHKRGKWVHNGRVNGAERILYSRVIGCDSFDGTHFTYESKDVAQFLPFQTCIPELAEVALRGYQKQVKVNLDQLRLAI